MRVSTAQVICAMGMSVTLHSSLLMLVNDNASTVVPTPIEDVFHVELATLDIEPDFNKEFFEPNNTIPLNNPPPDMTRRVHFIEELPALLKNPAQQDFLTQQRVDEVFQDKKMIEPKIASALEHFVSTQLVELKSEEGIHKLDPSDKLPAKPTGAVLPTREVPLQITEIDPGDALAPIKPKLQVPEPSSTRPVQSQSLSLTPQEALNFHPVSQQQKMTNPVRPIQNPNILKPALPNQLLQPRYLARGIERPNNISPVVAEESKLTLEPLAPVLEAIERSQEKTVLAVPVPERVLPVGEQTQEEKQAIAQYVTLLHNAISSRARRDYPSRAIQRREEGRVLAQIKVNSNGELLEIKISNKSTASDILIRAAERAITKEAPFTQFAQVVTKEARWFNLSLHYRITARSD